MKVFCPALLFMILQGCNANNKNSNVATLLSPTQQEAKSYDISGFMSFTNSTTFENVISYFEQKKITFSATTPDNLPNEISKYSWPGGTDFRYDWPIGNFIFIPELHIEDLLF